MGSLGGHNNDPPIFWPVDIKQQQLALLKSISAQKPESHQYKIDQLVPAPAKVVRLEVDDEINDGGSPV